MKEREKTTTTAAAAATMKMQLAKQSKGEEEGVMGH